MNRTARKGDLALVVNRKGRKSNGQMVRVLSDPFESDANYRGEIQPVDLRNWIESRSWNGKPASVCPTRCLIPILPPDEARTLFASESDAREVKA